MNTADDGLIVPLKNFINEAYAKDMPKKVSTAIDNKQRQGKFIGDIRQSGKRKGQGRKGLADSILHLSGNKLL